MASPLHSIFPALHLDAAGKTTEKVFVLLFFKGCLELYAFFLTCFSPALYLCLGIFLFYKLYFCGYAVSTQDHFWKKASGGWVEVMFGRKFLLRRMTLMNDSMVWDHQRERPNGCAAKDRLIFCCFIMIFSYLIFSPFFSIERCSDVPPPFTSCCFSFLLTPGFFIQQRNCLMF